LLIVFVSLVLGCCR